MLLPYSRAFRHRKPSTQMASAFGIEIDRMQVPLRHTQNSAQCKDKMQSESKEGSSLRDSIQTVRAGFRHAVIH
jgi:hypothetical protein